MPGPSTSHCYAAVGEFKDYMAGTSFSTGWTADAASVRRVLESVSRTIDHELGGRSFGPRVYTQVFDLGIGPLRNNVAIGGYSTAAPSLYAGAVRGSSMAYEINGYLSIGAAGLVPLQDWLLDDGTQAVTAYTTSDHTTAQTLAEGIGADYLLEPYNEPQKTMLKLYELTTKLLYAGQQTVRLTGTWGWQNVSTQPTTLSGNVTSTTAASITVADGTQIQPGNTLQVDAEQVYCTAVAANTLTVTRGVNGTTAATHLTGAAVSVFAYPPDITELALELARNRWQERSAGTTQTIGTPPLVFSRPGAEERALLRRLDFYLAARELGGVFF